MALASTTASAGRWPELAMAGEFRDVTLDEISKEITVGMSVLWLISMSKLECHF
jgi:hypothetical protein